MEDFKTRLITEEQELNIKIEKLESFLNSDKIKNIDKDQLDLLNSQLKAMKKYTHCLKMRLHLLEKKS